MDENTKNPLESQGSQKQQFVDPRPTDLKVFYDMLPGVLASFAAKSVDGRSAIASTFQTVRDALGQCAAMGLLRNVTQCLDTSPLATMPQTAYGPAGVAQPMQVPNQPGAGMPGGGGMVSQYPTYSQQPQQQRPYGQGPTPGQTSNIQPVAMFPTGGQQPPQSPQGF